MKPHPFVMQSIAAFDHNSELMADELELQDGEFLASIIAELNGFCRLDTTPGLVARLAHLGLCHTIQLVERRRQDRREQT
jgi:hypothetical protein